MCILHIIVVIFSAGLQKIEHRKRARTSTHNIIISSISQQYILRND